MKQFEVDDNEEKIGRWNKIEHAAFIEGIKLFGKNWKLVSQHIGTRSSTQVRSHAQKYFLRESTRQAVKQQAKEYYAKLPSITEIKKSTKDASTQYGEGISFPKIQIVSCMHVFV
ncbi:hypothetical protein SteCoe_5023 [Stentor coeruleus]|uniref:Uncharacterized protein n=1 Tax=Stentor coeruleus TaxID=5963 RepID=A0A1R2CTE6_9CILI|nr:hypothetical protein SteCoe_5023 [Stentor coeruleus]